jgi:hypothetical protein
MKRDIIRRSGLASTVAVFILLGAVLPNVLYLGHAQPAFSQSHAEHQSNTQQETSGEEHALHCHAGSAGCAGAQAMVGAIWVGEDSGLTPSANEARPISDASQPTAPEAPVSPILEPPRAS